MPTKDSELQARLAQLEQEIGRSQPLQNAYAPSSQKLETPPKAKTLAARFKANFVLPLQILAIPWTQEIIDQVFAQGQWNFPLHPRSLDGVPGIFLSAFSHGNFAHLIGNSIAFIIFSWLILLKSRRDYWITFFIGWLGGGLVSWLLGPTSVHGLSGVVYALFGYLLSIGWLERRVLPLLISVFVLLNYSAYIWGVLPTQPMVAWWGHLFGFVLGIVSAYGVYQEPHSS